ncbi:histidine kinase [Desulfofundulus sp. TPOSR]|uniref:histidine kinase n=1 Tax=Desulfofundulus kuznetsovii (strain DSM 6115 / VKM B-1805 / 17) TaxID=760568 RepID=A0AAU8Q4T4_DESK7|nr:sensor histidine kinase [Desulfofundulus sp. TPOSR]AEG16228.1 putative signal transduction histidine kinase [Desulfofundulus kuznetsovii DSM 6115]NHM27268.1 histidine kinase [Desulfofundulus sp. TPOSR]
MFDISALDRVIKDTLAAMENGRSQIFEIAEATQIECNRIQQELQQVMEELRKTIDQVDDLEIREKKARIHLMEVSRDFKRYREEDIKSAYETAQNLQLRLRDLRNQEKMLRFRRDQLEINLRHMKTSLAKVESTLAHLSTAINYLSNNLQQVSLKIGELQQLHDLGVSIIRAQEEERKRVAREIHDGPAQMMANIVMRAEFCLKLLEIDPARLKEELNALRELVRQSLQDVRKIIFDLRPMVLDDLGLVAALKRYVADFREQYGIAAEFSFFGQDRRLPVSTEVTLFRIVQECLNNVRKHAEARSVLIKMEVLPERVNLLVRDDGKGFDLEEVKNSSRPEGYGLINIRERAQLLNGSVQINTAPGRGTAVYVTVPLQE